MTAISNNIQNPKILILKNLLIVFKQNFNFHVYCNLIAGVIMNNFVFEQLFAWQVYVIILRSQRFLLPSIYRLQLGEIRTLICKLRFLEKIQRNKILVLKNLLIVFKQNFNCHVHSNFIGGVTMKNLVFEQKFVWQVYAIIFRF